jgi:hypothetical protein
MRHPELGQVAEVGEVFGTASGAFIVFEIIQADIQHHGCLANSIVL